MSFRPLTLTPPIASVKAGDAFENSISRVRYATCSEGRVATDIGAGYTFASDAEPLSGYLGAIDSLGWDFRTRCD